MKTANFYSSDRPISSKGQDLLGRAGFAERLAFDIQSWRGQDSLVIALFGAWGSGKSSLKNMILESLQRNESDRIPVLEFNPWQLSGTGNIPAVFFRELSIAVQSEGTQSDAEDRSKKLNAYATGLTLVGTTTEFVGKAMPWLGVPAGPIVETVGHSLKAAGASAKEGSEAHKAVSEAQQKSLQVQKTELAELLRQLPSPVLIVIDDIDRLTTDEILQVFQLVKANGDFPQLIYLLLFEREIVSKALNNVSGGKGTEFLEKIVQVAYHIPNASQSSVHKALFNGLNQLIDQHQLSTRWDKHRWIELFNDGIAEYFRNLRHVYRFLASLAFHVRQHRRGESFEVNPVDLIGLETLRVFEPSVYERIPGAKELVTGRYKIAYVWRAKTGSYRCRPRRNRFGRNREQ